MKKLLFVTALSALLLAACGDDTTTPATETEADKATAEEKTEQPVKEEKKDDTPREYKSALKSAESYAAMDMSKAAIYDQLVSEYGAAFPIEAAQYAIDNIEWDWKENALKSAKSYAEMDMSDAAIYDQLISEYGAQFTEEEAQYAIDNLE